MKSMLSIVDDHGQQYNCLMFVCPGCIEMVGGSGVHMLPVNSKVINPQWEWDGNLIRPTLSPSILTGRDSPDVCHSFLKDGIFDFLGDCTHSLAGQKVELPDLPTWVTDESETQ